MSNCPGKTSWPELVGELGQVAAATVELQNPQVDAMIVVEGTSVTGDFRCDRVWIWVTTGGIVDRVPTAG